MRMLGTVLRATSIPELSRLVASAPLLSVTTPLGYGRPVLLIPGFGAGDASLEVMGRWLRTRGYRTFRSRIGVNVGGNEYLLRRLVKRLERIHAATGQRVAIVGHSRGGILAKALATTRPDLVAGIVTLGSPTRSTWHVGAPRAARSRFPRAVGYVSVYSRTDRVAPWQACKHPAARHVEVNASHLGLAHNTAVYRALAQALPTFWPRDESWSVRARRQAGAWGRVVVPI